MAVFTNAGRTANTIRFYSEHSNLYFGLGGSLRWEDNTAYKTDTGETDKSDNNPPTPNASSKMYNLIGLKKVDTYKIVRPREEGDEDVPADEIISYRGNEWVIVDVEDADTDEHYPHHIFIQSVLTPLDNNSDVFSYRIVALYSNPTFTEAVAPNTHKFVKADRITDPGSMEFIDYRYPVIRQLDQTEYLSLMIEF